MEESVGYMHDLTRLLQHEFRKGKENPTCYYCDREFPADMNGFSNICIEHVHSVKECGKDAMDNYVISCKFCNSAKGSKSFHNPENAQELLEFKRVRRRVRELDNRWVKKLYNYMKLDKYPDLNFQNLLLEACSEEEFYLKLRKCNKYDGYWIEWESRYGGKWYFHLIGFELQPHFLFKKLQELKGAMRELIIDELYGYGYYADHQMMKYVQPFDNVEAGIKILKNEMEIIDGIYEKFSSILQR